MDKIVIESLRVATIIGVNEWERSVRQTLLITVELSCDVAKAAASDQLIDALDYASISDRIIAFASTQHFQLIETLAEQLAKMLLDEFPLQQVKIVLRKPCAIPHALSAGVQIERSRARK